MTLYCGPVANAPPACADLPARSRGSASAKAGPKLRFGEGRWDASRWPHFMPRETACPCCGETCVWLEALDALEALRTAMRAPLHINSGHRCALHNARVGGAPLSMHKSLAFDVALVGHDPATLAAAARDCGFRGFGFGQTFLHLDTRARRARWFYGERSKAKWTSLEVF